MKRIALALVATLATMAFAVTAAEAGPATPIGVAEAKRIAKKEVHGFCKQRANCRGSRVRKCTQISRLRVDCEGLIGKGRKQVCTFNISVVARPDRQYDIRIFGLKCFKP